MGNSLIITTGGGTDTSEGNPNVVEGVILTGYSAYNVEGERLSGSMPYQTTSSSNVNVDTAITIPAGYHDGTHSVSSVSLSSKTSATADAGHVLNAYKGWKSGSLITGTMANKGTTNGSISANGTYTVPVGWHNGSGKVTQSLSTQGATTVTPGTSNKTVIAASKWSTGNQVVAGNGNLAAGNIKKNVTIFGVTGSYQINKQSEVWLMNGWSVWGEANGVKVFRNDLEKIKDYFSHYDSATGHFHTEEKECYAFRASARTVPDKITNFGFWYYGNYTKLEITAKAEHKYHQMWTYIEQYNSTNITDSQRIWQKQIYYWDDYSMGKDWDVNGTFDLPSYNGGQMFMSIRTKGGGSIDGSTWSKFWFFTIRMY